MTHIPERLAIIGYGEAAEAFSSGWRQTYSGDITSFDLKVGQTGGRKKLEARASGARVKIAETVVDALADTPVIFSMVTADQALVAALNGAPHLSSGAIWFDCNSCSPGTKRQAALAVGMAGGIYVDVAVMAPVHPKRHQTPLLVSGPQIETVINVLRVLGMKPVPIGDNVGRASAIKMFRSVMIKGIEALTGECLLAARSAGVEDDVLASLQASDPGFDWTARSTYCLERMMVHGERRAAEMLEVSKTIAEVGLPSRMSDAIAEWQAQIAGLGLDGGAAKLSERADRILNAMAADKPDP
jgi:3-hydroxyisobutyrate dehydrogenase-like beta-hydroxyacid dehydrogenase